MESALCLCAAVAGAAWIAGEAWLIRRRLRATENRLARAEGAVWTLLDMQAGTRLDGHDADIARHARVIVEMYAAQHEDHRELQITELRLDDLCRAQHAYPPGRN